MDRFSPIICTVVAGMVRSPRLIYISFVGLILWSYSHQICAEKSGILELDPEIQIPTEYEIAVPFLSDNLGNFISFDLNDIFVEVARKKRSIVQEPLFIRLTLSKEDMLLKLKPNHQLIAPLATVEWLSGNKVYITELDSLDCFYTGRLVHRNCSHVAVSNCRGLMGLIKTDHQEYFIEPLENKNNSAGHQHVIYKRDSKEGGEIICSENSKDNHVRKKRSAKKKKKNKHIEVLLTADSTVVEFHGRSHVQIYLLSMMNIVNMIYQHESLEVKLNIVVVRMILMDANKINIIDGNARDTLENVCSWANSVQKSIDDPHHHDYVVFLSRESFGPAGYAPVTGMCYYPRSCSITKDEGLTSAFIVAHETGHVLGMHHDGDLNYCAPYTADGNIMAPLVQASYHRFYWSRCSNEFLKSRIHYFTCLDDTPFKHRWPKVRLPLGIRYTMDHQCRNEFGEGYRLCRAFPVYDPCNHLWCSTDDNPYLCKTKRGPPLEGTQCAAGKWCRAGHCVNVHMDTYFSPYPGGNSEPNSEEDDDDDEFPQETVIQHAEDFIDPQEQNLQRPVEIIHGSWSDWGGYGSCSRTCGTGAQFRKRSCDNPEPLNGGNPCKGPAENFQLCNTQACAKHIDFRAEQCRKINEYTNLNLNIDLTWVPYQPSNSSKICKLNCLAKETNKLMMTNENVVDGTVCSYDKPHDVCITGQCHHVGCDRVLNSKAKEDECGICEGDGAQCQEVEKLYLRAPKPGIRLVTVLPKGARHISIRDESNSANTLVLRRYKREKYILDGEIKLNSTLDAIEFGTRFVHRNDPHREEIVARGPTLGVVLVMLRVVTRNMPVMVTTRYVTLFNGGLENPLSDSKIKYQWEKDGWSQCSKSCGSGEQSMKHACKDQEEQITMDKKWCNHLKRPKEQKQTCNSFPCYFKWSTSDWEICSHTCGSQGVQQRQVNCILLDMENTTQYNNNETLSLSSKLCQEKKPKDKQSCNRIACPAVWKAGQWSECSKTCGPGVKTRSVKCVHPEEEVLKKCDENIPSSNEICTLKACPEDNCRYDRSVFCKMNILHRYCNLPSYNTLCCNTCRNLKNN